MHHDSFIRKVYNFVLRLRTMTLVYLLIGIWLAFLFFAILFRNASDLVQATLVALGFFFGGLAGLPIIINKEVDFTIMGFDGIPAVIFGIALSITGFFTATMFFIGILRLLFK
jgi:hypothetical protein